MGVPTDRLLLMNPDYVWRHTLTKGDYEAFPQLRMKSIFGLLDLKRQLMNADRASLIGAANYILLVRKGTDQRPAQQEEIDNLKENYNFIAKMPVIISDHRLEIDIIAPKIDLTLQSEKYDVLDTRILMRLLGTLSLGARGQRNETNVTLSHAVARMMENRRHMMKRSIERELAQAIVEHPNNKKPDLSQIIEEEPNLVFMPRNVTLGFDAALLQAMLSLRTQREISRETILEQFGLDQATEAMRMEHEEEFYDDIFKTQIPFAAPGVGGPPDRPANTGDPKANGAQGGRPPGGGAALGQTPPRRGRRPPTATPRRGAPDGRLLRDPRAAPGPLRRARSRATPKGEAIGEHGFLTEVAGRVILTAPAKTLSMASELPAELAERWEKASTGNPFMMWLQGRFVEAEKANRNGAFWSTEDLQFGEMSVKHGPLNWLHEETDRHRHHRRQRADPPAGAAAATGRGPC
jgi:hypothetical protein